MGTSGSVGHASGQPELNVHAVLESAPDAIGVVDEDGRLVVVNRETERLFGYNRDQLLGMPITVLLPGWQCVWLTASDGSSIATSPAEAGIDLVARRQDGREFPVEVRMAALETAHGRLVNNVIRDNTERKRVEDELRASQARLEGVLEIAEDAIISVDELQRIQRFNHGAEKAFGYTAAEVVGQSVDILIPQRFVGAHHHHVKAFGRGPEIARLMGERREIYGLRKDGTEFPGEASISKLTVGDEHIYTVILRDITERKRAADELERQVQHRTAHLNALLELSNELLLTRSLDEALRRALSHAMVLVPEAQRGAIYLYDPQGHRLALRASAGFPQLPSITVSADRGLLGDVFSSRQLRLLASGEAVARYAEQNGDLQSWSIFGFTQTAPTGAVALPLLTHDQPVGVMVLLREHGGEPFAAEAYATLEGLGNLTAAAIVEEQSQLAAASLSSQLAHLEEQQRTLADRLNYAEAGMLQAARLAAVGQLAASIAHEINNPLYAARNALYLIEEDLPPKLRESPYLRMVSDQLARIAGIIERMRDFYRPMRGELAPADINQLVEETLALAGLNLRHEGIDMIFAPAQDLPPVMCSADQLRQVLLNLVLNAIEAMPDGGTLTVRTEPGSTVVLILVQDTGVGIPEDIRAHLFEPFFTSKSNGTGLGLSISAHIVTQHGGQIEVDSRVGEGTTFRVVLPYQQKV